jgi:hypothetical protein
LALEDAPRDVVVDGRSSANPLVRDLGAARNLQDDDKPRRLVDEVHAAEVTDAHAPEPTAGEGRDFGRSEEAIPSVVGLFGCLSFEAR